MRLIIEKKGDGSKERVKSVELDSMGEPTRFDGFRLWWAGSMHVHFTERYII